jgi:hypothetical protein
MSLAALEQVAGGRTNGLLLRLTMIMTVMSASALRWVNEAIMSRHA